MRTYKFKAYQGIIGDFAKEWWTKEDHERHAAYVEELIATGRYGKEWEGEITLIDNPLYDDLRISGSPLKSIRMEMWDFSKL